MRILALIDYYLPGYKSGGPVRTLEGMVSLLPNEFRFWVISRDRDFGDEVPYPGVCGDAWNDVGAAKVFYCSASMVAVTTIGRLMKEVRPDVVYLNSLFSRNTFSYLLGRRMGLLPYARSIIAPRGECAPNAMRLKRWKKVPFVHLMSRMGAYRDLTWQASSSCEKTHIVEVMGRVDVQISQNIAIASDIVGRDNIFGRRFGPRAGKVRGCAHFVMVARITRMKNQLAAIEMLGKLRGQVSLELIGPVDDQAYWQKCAAAAKALPSNATVVYRGPLPPGQVSDALEANEFFVLPTRGENFGHAIFEALACSLPVLLSDTTSWPLLQDHGAGWTIPLANESAWIARMQACVDMAGDEYEGLVASTGAFAVGFAKADAAIEQNIRLFRGDL